MLPLGSFEKCGNMLCQNHIISPNGWLHGWPRTLKQNILNKLWFCNATLKNTLHSFLIQISTSKDKTLISLCKIKFWNLISLIINRN